MSPKAPKSSNRRKANSKQPAPKPPDNESFTEPADFIVDRLFRRGAISLIGGPTYVGKTTLLFQIIRDWMAGRPVFGHESHPASCCYMSTIHTAQHAKDVMNRVGAEVEVLSTTSSVSPRTFESICQEAIHAVPKLNVLFLDGIQPICTKNQNDPSAVADTISEINRALFQYNLTLVASGCSSKPKDHYASSRDRFAGAYSWLQGSSTFVSIDYVNPDNPSDARRTITIQSKSGLADRLHYKFSTQGILIPVLNGSTDPLLRFEDFDAVLFSNEPGAVLTTQDIVDVGEVLGLSRSTVNRRLIDLIDAGLVSKAKWGSYRIGRVQ